MRAKFWQIMLSRMEARRSRKGLPCRKPGSPVRFRSVPQRLPPQRLLTGVKGSLKNAVQIGFAFDHVGHQIGVIGNIGVVNEQGADLSADGLSVIEEEFRVHAASFRGWL
jgi:hypothetical protein